MSNFFERVEQVCRASSLPLMELETGSSRGPVARVAWTEASGVSLEPHRRFLVASITKPLIAVVAMRLVEQGYFGLNDRIHQYLHEFDNSTFRRITIRHLLTHTSGLPDMLTDNTQLRARHAGLAEYVAATSQCTPEFAPGIDCRYSSMGFAILGRIIEKLCGQPLREVCGQQLLAPLGMTESWLGLDEDRARELIALTVPCELPVWQSSDSDWNWNSVYWRTLGAPWGGLISTTGDLGLFARMFLLQGEVPGTEASLPGRVLSSMTVRAMCQHQTQLISGLPSVIAASQRWGLGWRLNWPDHAASFSDLVSPDTIGHWGATGTLLWIDHTNNRYCVILTPQPYEHSAEVIRRLSNLACGR